jgi:regulatory protein
MGRSILQPVTREAKLKGTADAAPRETPPAFERALRMLERRPHFRREIEQKLGRAGSPPEEIAEALARLAKLGYLDDAAFARGHAAVLAERKGYGRNRIRQELLRRGAPAEVVAEAVAALSGSGEGEPDADLERAREAVRRWAKRGSADRAALARHLDRKGFDRRVIFTVLKELAPDGASESFADD